jgi:16S rRNA processing protein RimM
MQQFFRIGIIVGAHGIKGEMKVKPTTDDPDRFSRLERAFFLDKTQSIERTLTILSARRHQSVVLLRCEGIDTPEAVLTLKGREIMIDRDQALPLAEDEYYIADLIGLKVVDLLGADVGELTDCMQTGANDVFVVKMSDGKEVLLPYIDDCVKSIDIASGVVTVDLMPGLI